MLFSSFQHVFVSYNEVKFNQKEVTYYTHHFAGKFAFLSAACKASRIRNSQYLKVCQNNILINEGSAYFFRILSCSFAKDFHSCKTNDISVCITRQTKIVTSVAFMRSSPPSTSCMSARNSIAAVHGSWASFDGRGFSRSMTSATSSPGSRVTVYGCTNSCSVEYGV